MKNMLAVAENEFLLLARNPIVIVFGIVMLAFAIVNAAGSSVNLQGLSSNHTDALLTGVFGFLWIFSLLFAFLSMCIGIMSVADEKSKGSLRVLLAKPLYRRDVITGKFLGISIFIFILIILTLTLFISLMIIVYSGPEYPIELVLRAASFAVLLFLNCSFTLGLVMCLSIILKKAEALVVSMSFVSFEWIITFGSLPSWLGDLQAINPGYLYIVNAIGISPNILFNVAFPFSSWFSDSLPYIVLMIAEVIIIILINCMLFNHEEA